MKKDYLSDLVYLDLRELRWYHKQYRVEGKEFEEFFQHGIAKHAGASTFKPRKSYSFYSSDYQDNEGIFYFGGFNDQEEENIVFQLVFNKLLPTFRRIEYSGTAPSPISPIVETYNENTLLIISGESNYREVRLFKVKQKSFTLISSYPQMGRFGGMGTSINLYGG